jgi:hypothetical protein
MLFFCAQENAVEIKRRASPATTANKLVAPINQAYVDLPLTGPRKRCWRLLRQSFMKG